MSLPEFSNLLLTAKNVILITPSAPFSGVRSHHLVGREQADRRDRCRYQDGRCQALSVMAKSAGATDSITLTRLR